MRLISIDECKEGMKVGKNIYSENGMLLLIKGNTLRQCHMDSLSRLGYPGIYIDDEFSKGIDVRELVDDATRNKANMAVKELFKSVGFSKLEKSIAAVNAIKDILADIVAQIFRNRDLIMNVSSLKSFDEYTYQHCVNVGIISIMLGKELGIPRSELIELGKSAFFHDIGKMFIPKLILNKPGKLTPIEFEEMKKHSEYGFTFIRGKLKQPDNICDGVFTHHEKYSGGGYPKNLTGEEIPLYGRIIAIADVYDSITSKRAYHEAMIASEGYEYVLANAGSHFDPNIVKIFLRKVAPFPAGSCVQLSNGERAVIVENRENLMMRPLVKLLLQDEKGADRYIDLANDPNVMSVTIVKTI